MPNILHRLSINAPPERVHQLAATREGIQQWWTGHAVTGDDTIGGQLSVYFSDPADAAGNPRSRGTQRGPNRLAMRQRSPGLDRHAHHLRAEAQA